MRFRDPYYLLLFVLWVPVLWFYITREKRQKASLRFSDLSVLKTIPATALLKLRHSTLFLFLAGTGYLIIALARPQVGVSDYELSAEGLDIMLILDISNSMRALDFQPKDRLEVSKERIVDFISRRENDRIGLVVFAARAYTKCPLTLDYNMLSQMVNQVTYTDFSNGTAIGTAIATAANRMKDSPEDSRVVILLTDGANNTGEIPPMAAAQAAAQLGIRIYTIGVGRLGQVPFPVETRHPISGAVTQRIQMIESDYDEEQLTAIAQMTGGRYFRAEDPKTLSEIYAEIDRLEKSDIVSQVYTNYSDHFFIWLLIGFFLLVLEQLLNNTLFRRIP